MLGAINRLPTGLLGFLGIKNGGEYPKTLGTELVPTINLAPWYLQANVIALRFTPVSVSAIGFNSLAQIPNDQAWAVVSAKMNSNAALGAGVTLKGFMAAAINDNFGVSNVAPLAGYFNATVGEVWVSAQFYPQPIILQPGTQLGAYVTNIAAGPVSCAMEIWYARLEA